MDQWGREGGHTGVAFQTKLTLLGVLDRARHDPNGKVIQQVDRHVPQALDGAHAQIAAAERRG